MAAVQAVGVDVETITFKIAEAADLPEGTDLATNAERVMLSSALAAPDSDADEARLAYLLCRAVGEMHVMRLGVESVSAGAFFIELAGAWAAYREWVVGHEMPAETLQRASLEEASLQDLGAYVGIALAGDAERQNAISEWLGPPAEDTDSQWLVRQTLEQLDGVQDFRDLLQFMNGVFTEMRRLAQE
jgi:hypothetical protein